MSDRRTRRAARAPSGRTAQLTTLAELAARLRTGRASPGTLVEECLERIAALNPSLNAFITVTADLAGHQAKEAERELAAGKYRGPLHGIPVAVKDFYDTAGIRTTAAAPQFANRIPSANADAVIQLADAGAVLVGKTNMHSLGMGTTSLVSHFGAVVNPLNAKYVAGGSSGGSAAAIAAGLCYATIDTDAVGSGRLPAAICGLACLKPSFGALSARGILGDAPPPDPAIPWLSHPSIMARTAADVSLVFEAMTGQRTASAVPRRVGIVTNFKGTATIRRAFAGAVKAIRELDIDTRDVEVPFGAASFDVRHIERDRASVGASLFSDVDVIVLPTLSAPAPTVARARALGDLAVSSDNTFFVNYFGLPAASVPFGRARNGLPPRRADRRTVRRRRRGIGAGDGASREPWPHRF